MILRGLPYLCLPLLAGLFSLSACKTNSFENEPPPADSSYFSIRQFIQDQAKTNFGAPHTLYRISQLNGQRDTELVSFLTMDWSAILGTFNAADISARKFLGKYDFSVSEEDITGNRGLTYTSNDPETFTRMLQINTDPSNNRITSIYIETAKRDFFGNKTQKLLYIPMSIIQIQETEGSLFGKARNLRVEYRFMEDDDAALEEEDMQL